MAALADPLELESLVTYRHICKIASGGMGEVRLVLRRGGSFVRLYALKRLHPHLREDPDVRASFLDEARIAGLLRHPNVVSVVDVGEDAEGPFLVMEYVDGMPLSAIAGRALQRQRPVPLGVALRIVMQAALGLAAAHDLTTPSGERLELVHRDISPQNILVAFDGSTRVTDFGIAKALGRQSQTATGLVKGKLGYMAPEQLLFRAPDHRTDLFALGVVLYELLAGRRLYGGKEMEESARRIVEEPPPDLGDEREDVPPAVVGLLFKMLAKKQDARPDDARVVARTLEGVLAELTSNGEDTDSSQYMIDLFGEERASRQSLIARAIDQADQPSTEYVSGAHLAVHHADTVLIEPPRPRRARFWAMATGALLIASLAIGVAAWAFIRPAAPPAPTVVLPAAPSRPPPAIEVAPLPPPPVATPAPPPVEEAPAAPAPRERRRGRRGGGGDNSLWGWQ